MSTALTNLTAALRRLDLSAPQQTVFLSLVQDGPATARVIAARTGLTRPSVYDQLKVLRQVGLVNELMRESKTNFAATDLTHIDNLLQDKIERIERSRVSLATSLPDLLDSAQTVSPKIRFFEGSEEIKNILKDVLWNAPKHITITWPSETMTEVFDAAYLTWFAERLQAHGYQLTLSATPGHPFFVTTKSSASCTFHKLTKRDTPTMATITYGTRTAHISSPREAFGFIVESQEYAKIAIR
jgi:DNA-binding transcriptional ArsR family regulator